MLFLQTSWIFLAIIVILIGAAGCFEEFYLTEEDDRHPGDFFSGLFCTVLAFSGLFIFWR